MFSAILDISSPQITIKSGEFLLVITRLNHIRGEVELPCSTKGDSFRSKYFPQLFSGAPVSRAESGFFVFVVFQVDNTFAKLSGIYARERHDSSFNFS
jgi:hypothetical protein